ncbi:hypothetical protein V2J09_010116, partial [Rumex salicifolius]
FSFFNSHNFANVQSFIKLIQSILCKNKIPSLSSLLFFTFMGIHHDYNTKCVVFLSLLFSLHLIAFSSPYIASAQQTGDGVIVSHSDFQALLAFKREADPRGVSLRSWNGTRNGACSGDWTGVKCVKGHVVALQLPFKGLGGVITAQIGLLRGLRRLSLHDNFITGTIPSSIGLLPSLRGLHLFNNRLSGLIPLSIGRSFSLQNVDLSNNFLTGSIPPIFGNATRLYRMNLSFNSLSGSIPNGLYLSPSLAFLSLEHNNLSGLIADTWGREQKGSRNIISKLQVLNLDYNLFSGNIPHSLSNLGSLQVLSLSHNRLTASIPDELGSLIALRTLDLSSNAINGSVPQSINNLSSLVTLNLDNNHLEGQIPKAMGNLGSLTHLDLSQNNFTGDIPASISSISNLTSLNVSHNSLSGEVPSGLSKKFNSSSFIGNLQLCGYSISTPCPSSPPSSLPAEPNHHHKPKLRTKDIILIMVGAILALLLLLCCILLCCLIRVKARSKERNGKTLQKEVDTRGEASGPGGSGGGKLVLFDGPLVFTADNLLCATAEVMAKNAYGTVYKASMEDGNQVAVKRLREKLAKSPKEFELEIAALGRIRHPNLLPLRAYYIGPKAEKLLVFDCSFKGSLSSFLHGHGPETTIDWPTRMKIVEGISRGLHHLHVEENMVHGSLTASEVFVDEQNKPKIAEYGISRLMTDSANSNVATTAGSTGYRAPELHKIKNATTKSDMYSLGVIMLELLTGKPPGEQIDGVDLPQWVASTVKKERTNEVFDLELMGDASATGDEMLNTLKLALNLVDTLPETRPAVQLLPASEKNSAMEGDISLGRVTITGTNLASLLHRCSTDLGDADGLLFGRVSLITASSLSDDDSSSIPPAVVASVTGFCSAGTTSSFYDSVGNLDLAKIRRFLYLFPSHHLLGWFSSRRRSPLRPSLREFSVSRALSSESEFASDIENFSSSFFPSIFLLIIPPSSNHQTLIHTHDYRVYQFRASTCAFEAKPFEIVNIGPAFRGHYSNFIPNSDFPYLSCNVTNSSNNEVARGSDSLTYMKQLFEDQKQLNIYAEGYEVKNLNKFAGNGANYTSKLEDLYEKMLAKLTTLARLVEISSAKLLEQVTTITEQLLIDSCHILIELWNAADLDHNLTGKLQCSVKGQNCWIGMITFCA